ncbi:GGDEF domain-containing protein [Caminibacter sp.]
MKKIAYLSLLTIILFTIAVSIITIKNVEQKLIINFAKKDYEIRIKEFNVLLNDKKTFLDSFAKFLSTSPEIINGYLENNRRKIISYVMPLYKNLYPKFIEEIHFFKPPATSFVNFANLKTYNINLLNIRKDIAWIDSSFTPSTHFYICRYYPGLRATYPIIYKNRLLGSVSFGMNIKIFKDLFEKLGAKEVSIYLKENDLKQALAPKRFQTYAKYPEYKGYKVIGKVFNVSMTPGYEIKRNKVFIKIPIKDFFNRVISYIVIEDDISKTILEIKKTLFTKLIIEIISYIFIFIIVIMIFRAIFHKTHKLYEILNHIKNKEFNKLPSKTKPKDELDEFRNNLIDVAEELKKYISALNMEIEKFENKAYIDGLTNTLNRMFLEDKAKELFLKHNPQKKPMGIIMFDIDNFKKINDTYGHDIGDLVLIEIANTVNKLIRKEDYFIRYGGEEFVILLPNTNIKNTLQIAEKIRKNIENLNIKLPDSKKTLKVTVSIGISETHTNDSSVFEAIKRADINLYKAKKSGKNRVVV